MEEDYSYIEPLVTGELRPLLSTIRQALLEIHHRFGLGYSDTVYRRLLQIAVRYHGLRCDGDQIVATQFHAVPLPSSPITAQSVEGQILVDIEAIQDHITARAVRTMQTHLGVTGAEFGLVVNFGKSRFEIRGVRPRNTN